MSEYQTPRHIGFIIDGNRRWAKQHGLPAYEGHMAGYNTLEDVLVDTIKMGVEYVSIYIFSTENWKRSQDEIKRLMSLILKLLIKDIEILEKNDIKLLVLGSRENVSDRILKAIDEAEERTKNNKSGTLALCFNYGGHLEIVDAVKKIVAAGVLVNEINEQTIEQNLYAPEVPPLDLVVRTSGEQRISNFMLWRSSYAEFIFLDKLWPDMKKEDVQAILQEYSKRHRRIGK